MRAQSARHTQAYLASLDRICRQLLAAGHDPVSLCGMRLIDVPQSPERAGLVFGRVVLGMTTLPHDPLLVDECGDEITADEVGHRFTLSSIIIPRAI